MMEILDKRLNDKGKNWRHVFKALTLLEYLLQSGSESVWLYFHDNIYIVKTLKEFQYLDDAHVDQGINVRQKAKEITALLMDETRARARRRARFDEGSHAQRDPDDFSDEAGRRRGAGAPRPPAGARARASAKVRRMALSISPRCPAACHSPKLPVIALTPAEAAMAWASQDLPVPGGP